MVYPTYTPHRVIVKRTNDPTSANQVKTTKSLNEDEYRNLDVGTGPQGETSYNNLIIETTSVSAISITATSIDVENIRLSNVSTSADIPVSGAGGLDSGSETANIWYAI